MGAKNVSELTKAKESWDSLLKMYDVRITRLEGLKASTKDKVAKIATCYSKLETSISNKSEKSKKHEGLAKLPLFSEETKDQLSHKLLNIRSEDLEKAIDDEIAVCRERQEHLKGKQL